MSDSSEFSLDDLIVTDEEVRPPVIWTVSIVVSETEYTEQKKELTRLTKEIESALLENYPFQRTERKRYKAGFLAFDCSGNVITCAYARESPTRLDFELDDLKIHTKRLRSISPSYRVKILITVGKTKSKVVLFGGDDKITSRALGLVNVCIRKCIRGGHKTYETSFSNEEMNAMRENFGMDIQYVYIAPGENKRLRKIVERKEQGQIKKILQYSVYTKFAGYRILASPVVLELIKEEGIRIREIEGRINFAPGISITTRVSASGRILFFIPDNVIGKKNSAFDIAEELYTRMVTQRTGAKQITMEEYFPGST